MIKVKKMSISLPFETLAMIDWIVEHEFYFGALSFSYTLRMIIEKYFYICLSNENIQDDDIARARDFVRARAIEIEKNFFSQSQTEFVNILTPEN